jgi:DNA helicase HerA-like ATPase
MEATLAAHLADYRSLRRELESSILPIATSVDGRRFEFQAPLDPLELRVGGYVTLGDDRLGQVTSLGVVSTDAGEIGWNSEGPMSQSTTLRIRAASGGGQVLGGDGTPFHDALLRPATPDEVVAWLRTTAPPRAVLPVGELVYAPGLLHALDAGGFNRHTFLCGQSGSGKTYALGVLLERLLLETSLRIVVLDPNSDYVRLGELRDGVAPEVSDRYAAAAQGIAVHSGERLRVRLPELDTAGRAAALQLDPIRDREEYAALAALLEEAQPDKIADFENVNPALGRRAHNLGVHAWGVWARGAASSLDALEDPDARCVVIDLGSLHTREEQALVAQAVLERLWSLRARREPVLIVIDEAHNVCPALPEDALTSLATMHAVRIAAEGRKFGLYLLTATQRPQKVHPNVVSQCDNLVLMRMNSLGDLDYAREVFSFVPAPLLERATTFGLGEALVAGKLSSHPAFVRIGPRIAQEGGADVPTTWAQA